MTAQEQGLKWIATHYYSDSWENYNMAVQEYLLSQKDSNYPILQITVPDYTASSKTTEDITYTVDPEKDPADIRNND